MLVKNEEEEAEEEEEEEEEERRGCRKDTTNTTTTATTTIHNTLVIHCTITADRPPCRRLVPHMNSPTKGDLGYLRWLRFCTGRHRWARGGAEAQAGAQAGAQMAGVVHKRRSCGMHNNNRTSIGCRTTTSLPSNNRTTTTNRHRRTCSCWRQHDSGPKPPTRLATPARGAAAIRVDRMPRRRRRGEQHGWWPPTWAEEGLERWGELVGGGGEGDPAEGAGLANTSQEARSGEGGEGGWSK